MSVFGYDPRRFFTGRGPLEAAVHGLELGADEVAFRCNLVTVEGEILKDFSADHISTAEATALLGAFDESIRPKFGDRVRFYPGKGTGYRNLMITRHGREIEKASCTPPHDIMGKPYAEYLPEGPQADLLNGLMKSSREFFRSHPVN